MNQSHTTGLQGCATWQPAGLNAVYLMLSSLPLAVTLIPGHISSDAMSEMPDPHANTQTPKVCQAFLE